MNYRPFEQGRSIQSQLTARRLNEMERERTRVRFSGTGAAVSHLANQTFVQVRKWRGPSPILHPLWVYDVSAGGGVGKVSVTPGIIEDAGNASTPWIPLINGNPINVTTGSPPAYPALTVGDSDTVVYSYSSINSTTGFITYVGITSATSLPASDSNNWYMLISTIAVTVTGGVRSVQCNNDGVSGSQIFTICGIPPLTDGSAYRHDPI